MFIEIHNLKNLGLKATQIARHLNLSRTTIYKYLDMGEDEFHEMMEAQKPRNKKLDSYHNIILSWLREYPDLSASQVQVLDWLVERYGPIDVCEGTVRNYVRGIRNSYNILKVVYKRQYEAIEDPPMGYQLQVDFEETKVDTIHGHKAKLYFIAFVLSHSRYKYVEWLDRFTTADVINAHENAFSFFGGIPKEIVYDQDHLILVSKNYGDLILTYEFARYKKKRDFSVYMCRKQDPESKGRIENVVGFVKKNFSYSLPLGTYDGKDKYITYRR